MTTRRLSVRLAVVDSGKVKAELRELGEGRQRSLRSHVLAGCLGGICGHFAAFQGIY
jgi:hypothetical protein